MLIKKISLWLALACTVFLLLFSFRNCAEITCTFGARQSPGDERSETTPYYNIGSFSIVQPRELSHAPNVQVIPAQFLKQPTSSDAKLVIGTNAEFPPFTFRQDGKIVGFDIDIAKEVCSRLGKEALFKDMPFDGLIPDLSLGQVDFIAAGMTPTPERAKRVSFTEPYLKEDPLVALVLAEAAATPLEDLNSLEGKKIVVNEGYTADLLLSGKEELDLTRLASPTDGFLALKSGRADVFVTAKSTLHSFLKTQNPGEFYAFPLLNENPDTCALVVAKNNSDLLHKIQAALDEMQQDGTIAQLKTRWNLGD